MSGSDEVFVPVLVRRELIVYLNAFSGEATIEFPSTLQMARGGVCFFRINPGKFFLLSHCSTFVMYFVVNLKILADAMGLGKTIMTISLLVAHSGKGESVGNQPISKSFTEGGEVSDSVHTFSNIPKKATKFSGFDKPTKQRNSLTCGGNLIICPMTLLGQWKVVLTIL